MASKVSVIFRRIHGRLVPIKVGGGTSDFVARKLHGNAVKARARRMGAARFKRMGIKKKPLSFGQSVAVGLGAGIIASALLRPRKKR